MKKFILLLLILLALSCENCFKVKRGMVDQSTDEYNEIMGTQDSTKNEDK